MKYFILANERRSTCYHEWQKGRFDGVTFWKSNSLLLSDDIICELFLEERLFKNVFDNYESYGETEVSKAQWEAVLKMAAEIGGEIGECIAEADVWVQETFEEYDVFTMIGL